MLPGSCQVFKFNFWGVHMSFFKFSKFSKFLSTCFAFSFLFSGSQTYSMESRNLGNRMNLDMLGIGIRNNLGDDNESAATKSTVASPLDGIEVKIPEKCEFCDQKVFRRVSYAGCHLLYICKNNNCLQKCYDKFLSFVGLGSRNLDTGVVQRCDFFKKNMESLDKLKKANYRLPGMSEEDCKLWCDGWERYNEDRFVDTLFVACGHSICNCKECFGKLKEKLPQMGIKYKLCCPKCKAEFGFWHAMTVASVWYNEHADARDRCARLLSEKLNGEWSDHIIFLSYNKGDVIGNLCMYFEKDYLKGLVRPTFESDESKFNAVDNDMRLGTKILVLDLCKNTLASLKISNLDGYIKCLIKLGRYKDIIYPVEGELHEKIKAIAIKFMEDNTITVPKKLYDEICSKMLKDDVE